MSVPRHRHYRTRTVKSGRYLYTPDAPRRFIRCQYCGFICDTTRDPLQPTSGEVVTQPDSNIYHKFHAEIPTDYYTSAYESSPTIFTYYPATTVTSHYYSEILCEDGNYIQIETADYYIALENSIVCRFYSVEITHNCPFCGGQYTKLPPKY